MNYSEYDVPSDLQRQVQCVWHLKGQAEPVQVDTIYPDGCCELIVHLGQPPRMRQLPDRWIQQSTCLFAAQHRSAIRLAQRGAIECIGVRLRPAASAALSDTPLTKLRDRIVDLYSVNESFARRFEQQVRSHSQQPFGPYLWTLLSAGLGRFKPEPCIERTVTEILRHLGDCRIEPLATAESMSLRALQMKFINAVGLSLKEFSRIIRLQTTLHYLDERVGSLADLAIEAGFSDQAHANREMRRMTGLTPARLRNALQASPGEEQTIRLAAAFVRGKARGQSKVPE